MKVPHQAVILVRSEIHERLPSGQVSGRSKETKSKVYTVFGDSFEECQDKVKQFTERLENASTEEASSDA